MNNINQFCHRLEQVIQDLTLVQEFLQHQIDKGVFALNKNGEVGVRELLEHAAWTIGRQVDIANHWSK